MFSLDQEKNSKLCDDPVDDSNSIDFDGEFCFHQKLFVELNQGDEKIMLWRKRSYQVVLLAVTLITTEVGLNLPNRTVAQDIQENILSTSEADIRSTTQLQAQSEVDFQPPNRGAPPNRQDAGSRGPCPNYKGPKVMRALIPMSKWDQTLAAYPTFWFYIPVKTGIAEFVLKETVTQTVLYKHKFPITQGHGIVSYQPPETKPPLEVGKAYQWEFSFFCNPNSQPNFFLRGVVARTVASGDLQQELEEAEPQKKVEIYARSGLWYEAITLLAKLRQADPQNEELAADWMSLLQDEDVNLGSVTQEPILPCCQIEPQQERVEK